MSAVPAASPTMDLQRALPVLSPSTTWESPTLAAPQSMEIRHLGVPPRLTPTTTMSLELVLGDTVMPPALFKVEKRHNSIGKRVNTSFSHPETAATTTAAPATTAAPGPVVTAAPGTCQVP